jgi:hypothetical protein
MTKPYSLDLRDRAVARVAAGETVRSVAATLRVGVLSVVKWSPRFRATGRAAPRKMGGHRPRGTALESRGHGRGIKAFSNAHPPPFAMPTCFARWNLWLAPPAGKARRSGVCRDRRRPSTRAQSYGFAQQPLALGAQGIFFDPFRAACQNGVGEDEELSCASDKCEFDGFAGDFQARIQCDQGWIPLEGCRQGGGIEAFSNAVTPPAM